MHTYIYIYIYFLSAAAVLVRPADLHLGLRLRLPGALQEGLGLRICVYIYTYICTERVRERERACIAVFRKALACEHAPPSRHHVLLMSCNIHTHTPARANHTNFQLYYLLYMFALQTVLGMGNGMNVTAQFSRARLRPYVLSGGRLARYDNGVARVCRCLRISLLMAYLLGLPSPASASLGKHDCVSN